MDRQESIQDIRPVFCQRNILPDPAAHLHPQDKVVQGDEQPDNAHDGNHGKTNISGDDHLRTLDPVHQLPVKISEHQ